MKNIYWSLFLGYCFTKKFNFLIAKILVCKFAVNNDILSNLLENIYFKKTAQEFPIEIRDR